ncbi:hypothetical protein MC885_012720, partial [Smutsia gigantea]
MVHKQHLLVELQFSIEKWEFQSIPLFTLDDNATCKEGEIITDPFKGFQCCSVNMGRLAEADSWEIIEGLKIGQTNVQRPDKHEGFMLKKRKWPLKGWHKRFFVLDNGMLKYSKAPLDIQKGKVHGSIDVGLSVMSIKKKARRIDLDTEEHIYHLKVKSQDWFDAWVSKLRHHRLYRQNEIVRSPRDASFHIFPSTSTAEFSPAANISVVDGK